MLQRWTSLVHSAKYQVYKSSTHDPFLNLAIEHYLLQKSLSTSTILFLYINRPCVVIGRNQNPWLETNLGLLQKSHTLSASERSPYDLNDVKLVRRRSGGGAVFHDGGNVNYSVICPPESFTRDKHAEMVTKAIRTFNDRARVNSRHDIVLDSGPPLPSSARPPESDMHMTKYSQPDQSLKISGSAYKLIRDRSLHHGTCLVASPNLSAISQHLRSPARPFMKAKGVESVPSPIGNAATFDGQSLIHGKPVQIETHTELFQDRVMEAFADMYGLQGRGVRNLVSANSADKSIRSEDDLATGLIGDEASGVQEIAEGIKELKSSNWIFGQTPHFTLSSHAIDEQNPKWPSSPPELPSSARVYIAGRGGVITDCKISLSSTTEASIEPNRLNESLKGRAIHQITDFRETLQGVVGPTGSEAEQEYSSVMIWLNKIFGKTSVDTV